MQRIPKEKAVLAMSPANAPVLRVKSDSAVVFETCDCFSNKIQSEDQLFGSVGWDSINPATGPLYVEGAEPNDILKVEILDIAIADKGVMTTAPNFGVLGDLFQEEVTKIVPIKNDQAIFNDRIRIPIKPMIGVLGVAPAEGEILTGTPGEHGANMDCKRLVKGSTIYLPVKVKGALLSMGDLHAVQADGEIVICAVEIPGEVTVKITVVKNKSLPLPMLVEGDDVMTIASAESLDEAATIATKNMHLFLMNELKMDKHEAGMLLSLIGELKICQVVDPLKTARMEFPRWVLEKYNYSMV
ncbi:MAG: acetamidase/formamidase family protein [Desulfobacterales bacterium]|nr:MAG: acetamidase/formamidase family protein [Desulfobacterales bacterium]